MQNANTKFAKTNSPSSCKLARAKPHISQRGLTLVEILVVIAISILLFLLLLRPLTDSFKLTQQAQAITAAQDAARKTLEQLTRELGSAVFVFDNASHPFNGANDSATALNDRYTNFLDFEVPSNSGGSVQTYTVAHAYNCKIDMVMAAHNTTGGLTDPTTHEPILLSPSGTGSAAITSTNLVFPLAPGTTIIRWFVGLRNPTRDYSNANEGIVNSNNDTTNTYILYRVEFSPYNSTSTAINTDGTHINEKLFVPQRDTTGTVINKPEIDDPDFFRYVKVGDTNWLAPNHASYTSATMGMHNALVDHWIQIAKPVITAPEVDLLLLPHNTDRSIDYDTGAPGSPICAAAGTCAGVAHFGLARDIVTGTDYPIVNSSVTFRPTTVSSDAAPSTTVDYASLGVPADAANNNGFPYVPSVYTASSQSWSVPYHISLYPLSATSATATPAIDPTKPYFTVTMASITAAATATTPPITAGDAVEYLYQSATDTNPTPVLDLNSGLISGNKWVPITVNSDTGTITFDTPAIPPLVSHQLTPYSIPPPASVPAPPTSPPSPPEWTGPSGYPPDSSNNRFWFFGADDINTGRYPASGVTQGVIDLTKLTDNAATPNLATPLAPTDGTAPAGAQVANAHIVPGSLSVYGPDTLTGPNQGNLVLYSPVFLPSDLSANHYCPDYKNGTITFFGTGSAERLPELKADGVTTAEPIEIRFDYQANLAPLVSSALDPSPPGSTVISDANPAAAMLVKVDYQTRDIIAANIGVRIYDSGGNGRAELVNQEADIRIGNSNR